MLQLRWQQWHAGRQPQWRRQRRQQRSSCSSSSPCSSNCKRQYRSFSSSIAAQAACSWKP